MVIIMIKIIKDILTDENFIGAILTSLSFIFIGFVLRRKNIINNKKNSKDKTKKFQPPTLEEVRSYAMDRDREDLADKFFEYYNEGGWCDNQGKKLANWKQKFIRWEDWNPVKDDDDSGYVPGQVLALFD